MKYSGLMKVFFFSVVLAFTQGCFHSSPVTEKGLLSLEKIGHNDLVEIKGPWEFYAGKFYLGKDFSTSEALSVKTYRNYNTDRFRTVINSFKVQKFGFATLRIKIKAPAVLKDKLLILIPDYDTAVNIYCNNRLIYSNGKTGTTAPTTKIEKYGSYVAEVQPVNGIIELVMHISRFQFSNTSIKGQIIIGFSNSITKFIKITEYIIMALIGCIMLMGLYDLLLFFVMQHNQLYFNFSIVCFASAFHIIVSTDPLLTIIGISPELLTMIRYISWVIAVYFYFRFFMNIFKKKYHFISTVYAICTIFICAVIIITPFSFYNFVYYPITLLYVFSIFYFLTVSIDEFIKKSNNSAILLFSLVLVFPLMFIDFFTHLSINRFNVVSPAEILLFCIIQSIIIGRSINEQFRENRNIASALLQSNTELTVLNKHLGKIVAEKTDELTQRNFAISEQNRQIRNININLEKRIKEAVEEIRRKDDMLTINSRQAAMGELMGFIGHQWKQYLYAISLHTGSMKNILAQKKKLMLTH